MGPRSLALLLVLPLLGSEPRGAVATRCGRILQGPDAERTDGADRMRAELARLAERSALEDDYLGSAGVERARRAAAELGDGAPLVQRIRTWLELGRLELRAGRAEDAIAAFERAREALGAADVASPRLGNRIGYELALAHLRLGERENCVARHTAESCILPIRGAGVHAVQGPSRRAMELLVEVLDRCDEGDPMRLCARWLLHVAAMTVGEWPAGVREDLLLPAELFAPRADFPRFRDVAPELGVAGFDLCGGALVEDFDGDGAYDLLSSSWELGSPLRLYRRDADGAFVRAAEEASGLAGLGGGLNLVQADHDGDGDVDVLVLRGAWLSGSAGRLPNSLLENDGTGRFRDVTFAAGLGEAAFPTQAAAWADYDLDGDLDLYVANESSARAPSPSQLFRNEGDGTFVDVAAAAGVTNMRFAKGAAWGDHDGDGDPDLYVSNLRGWNRLYRNEGDGTFHDVAPEVGVMEPYDSFPVWFWDYDNDGALDLYVASYPQGSLAGSHDALRLYPTIAAALGEPPGAERARLYRGDGRGGFAEVGEELGLTGVALTMGANFGDLDNDGWLDLYLGTGYPYFDGIVPNVMLRSRGGRAFEDVTLAGGFGHLQKGHGVVFADLDADGDQDVFEQVGGAYRGDAFGNVLFENPGTPNHWVRIELEGVRSNRRGLGARLEVVVEEDGALRSIHRVAGGTGSFGGNPLDTHVGLGGAGRIRALEVRWPATGLRQRFEDLPVDRRLLVREGSPEVEVAAPRPAPFRG